LHFEIDEKNKSIYQFIGVKPLGIDPNYADELDQ